MLKRIRVYPTGGAAVDVVAEEIARFGRLSVDTRGECYGKAEIVEQLEDSFNDQRVVDFFLGVLGDRAEYDLARVAVCKFLELDPPTTPPVRRRIAEVLATALQSEQDVLVRQWLGIALRGYLDLAPAFEAAVSAVSDANEDEDVRHNCLTALQQLGATEVVAKIFKEIAAGSGSIATTARRQLSEWGIA